MRNITPIKYAVHPADESPIIGEHVTWVNLEDDGGGQFVSICDGENTVRLDPDEILPVFETCKKLLGIEG